MPNDNDPIGDLADYMRGSAFGGSGPLGLPRNLAEYIGMEDSREKSSNPTAGEGAGAAILIIVAIPIVVASLLWLYPVAAIVILALWHILSYLLSGLAANLFSPVNWCPTSSFFSLLPTMLFGDDGVPDCSVIAAHGLIGYNGWAVVAASTITVLICIPVLLRLERALARNGTYVAARHAWRCLLPPAALVLWLSFQSLLNLIAPIVLIAASVVLAAAALLCSGVLSKNRLTDKGTRPQLYRRVGWGAIVTVGFATIIWTQLPHTGHLTASSLTAGLTKQQMVELANDLHGKTLADIETTRFAKVYAIGPSCPVPADTHLRGLRFVTRNDSEVAAVAALPRYLCPPTGENYDGARDFQFSTGVYFPMAALPLKDLFTRYVTQRPATPGANSAIPTYTIQQVDADPTLKHFLPSAPGIVATVTDEIPTKACRVPKGTVVNLKAYVILNAGTPISKYVGAVQLPVELCGGRFSSSDLALFPESALSIKHDPKASAGRSVP